jgi:hypothetical protein
VAGRALSGQGVNPDKARVRKKVKAAKAVLTEGKTKKDKNYFKKGE